MASLQKRLKAAQGAFAKARKKVEEGGSGGEFFDEVGRFDTQVSGGEVNESQNGRLQAYLEYTVLDGEFKGETFRSYYGLEKEESIAILLKDIQRLGFEVPESIDEVEDKLEEIVKAKPKIKVKRVQKGEFINNYLQKLIEGEDAEEQQAEETAGAAEDNTQAEEQSGEEFVPEVGQKVQHEKHGVGTVKSTDEDDKDALVKWESGEKTTVAWSELSAAAEETPAEEPSSGGSNGHESNEGDGDIAVGMRLQVDDPKQKIDGIGKVTALHEKSGEVSLKMEKGGKVVKVAVDCLSLPPEPAPAKKPMRVGKK